MCMNYWDVGKVTRILVPLIETPGAECQRSRPTCWLIAHLSLDEDESGDILEIFICFGAKASPSNGFGWVSGWRGVKRRNSTKLRQREEIHATCQMSFLHFGACMYIIFGYFCFVQLAHSKLKHWDAYCLVLPVSQIIRQWLATIAHCHNQHFNKSRLWYKCTACSILRLHLLPADLADYIHAYA